MSENEFDVQRDRAEEDRENVVLTGEEIELPISIGMRPDLTTRRERLEQEGRTPGGQRPQH